jgi:hypothetical protein
VTGDLIPDSDLLEYVCNENEKDSTHLVGKASDEKGVEVAPEILARYAGVYAGAIGGRPRRFEIFPSGRELLFSRDGSAKQPLTPVASTKFVMPNAGFQIEFVEEDGEIVALQFYASRSRPGCRMFVRSSEA